MTEEVTETPAETPEAPVEEPKETVEEPKEKPKDDEEPEWFKKRFAKITKQRHDAERQLEAERSRSERLERLLEQSIGKKETVREDAPTRAKPTLEQHDFDQAKYIEDLTDWKIEQREAKRQEEQRKTSEQKSQQELVRRFEEKRQKVMDAGNQEYDDFEEVVRSLPGSIMTPQLAVALAEFGSHKVAYYVCKNPLEAEKISRLTPYQIAVALGKIEARLEAEPKQTTQAPPPSKPVGGADPGRITNAELAKTNPKEWMRLRNEGKI